MYGLKQAARLAYDHLKAKLKTDGYSPDPFATNTWKHTTRPTNFCLCVDDFGIKYYTPEDAHHLLTTLQKHYDITVDWSGANYCGMTIKWDYVNGFADISMPGYVKKALKKLNHQPSKVPQYAPHQWVVPAYGNKQQYAPLEPPSEPLLPQETKHIQSVVGTFLYYGRAIDSTILPAINDIASSQAKPTQKTKQKVQMLLDYLHTNPNATIRFYASDMILHADSDAAYPVMPGAKSRIAGYYHLSNTPPINKPPSPFINGAVHVECKALRNVVTSAAEAETAALFYNAKTIIELRRILHALGHVQPPTPIKTDNSTAFGFITNFVHKKKQQKLEYAFPLAQRIS